MEIQWLCVLQNRVEFKITILGRLVEIIFYIRK